MKTILDFAVWTLGAALALPVWLQSTFLPREMDFWYWVVIVAMMSSAISAVLGIWFRSAASKVLAQDEKAKPTGHERQLRIGAFHSGFLILALSLSAAAFVWIKVIRTEPAERCTLEVPSTGDQPPLVLKFECSVDLAAALGATS